MVSRASATRRRVQGGGRGRRPARDGETLGPFDQGVEHDALDRQRDQPGEQ